MPQPLPQFCFESQSCFKAFPKVNVGWCRPLVLVCPLGWPALSEVLAWGRCALLRDLPIW